MRVFISHITEEAPVANQLKSALTKDFSGVFTVFVSSDGTSIALGEEWLKYIKKALKDCSILIVLCSPSSIHRPWVNFEIGAAWLKKIPIIPVCHNGLTVRDLPMPLSLRNGISLDDPVGLRCLYDSIANKVSIANNSSYQVPHCDFTKIINDLKIANDQIIKSDERSSESLQKDRIISDRLHQALSHNKYKWRSLERLAIEVASSEEMVAERLLADPDVVFSKGISGKIIVGLRKIVHPGE